MGDGFGMKLRKGYEKTGKEYEVHFYYTVLRRGDPYPPQAGARKLTCKNGLKWGWTYALIIFKNSIVYI